MHAGRRFFGHALDGGEPFGVPARLRREPLLDRGEQNAFFFAARLVEDVNVLLGPGPEVEQQRRIAAVVEDHVREAAVGPLEDLVGVIPVFGERFALVGEDRDAGSGDGGGSVVLRGEDIARRPADLGPEILQRLDQHGRLNRHVQRAGDAGTLERLALGILFADRHEAGHFGFGDRDFLAAPRGQARCRRRESL